MPTQFLYLLIPNNCVLWNFIGLFLHIDPTQSGSSACCCAFMRFHRKELHDMKSRKFFLRVL